jgi:nicotinamide riboside kinase
MASKINKEIFKKEILKGTSLWEAAQLAGSEATGKINLSRVACRLKEDLGIESVGDYQREKVRNAMRELSELVNI